MSSKSSTSQPQRRWLTGSTNWTRTTPFSSSTSAAAPSTSPSCALSITRSRCSQPMAIIGLAKDWDDVIVNLIAEEFDRLHGENPLLDLHSYQDLHNRALAAKIQLSSRDSTTIVYHHGGKSVKLTLTRKEFEKRTRHLVEKCKTICEMVMQEAKMKWDKIDKVLLAGGMTRMPMMRAMIAGFASVPLIDHVNPDEVVARGAAIQGILSMLSEEDISGERVLDDAVRRQFSS